jgi:hypothetical protein
VRKVDRMLVDHRPGGLALIVILPPIVDLANDPSVFHLLERSRPHGVFPFHGEFSPRELAQVLRRPPEDLGGCITEYLAWRGIGLDRGTVHLIRRTIDLSANLRSVCPHCPGASTCHGEPWAADSRNAAFLSRLTGFRSVGCFGVAIKLQNSDDNVFSVAYATRSSLSSASTPVPTHARRGGSRPSDGLILPNPHTALQPADARGSARQNVLPSRSGASPRAAARGHGAEGLPLGKHQVQMFTGGRKQYGYEVSPVKLTALAQKTSPRHLTGGRAELIGVW